MEGVPSGVVYLQCLLSHKGGVLNTVAAYEHSLQANLAESTFRNCPKRGTSKTLSVNIGGVGRPKWVEKYRSGAP